MVINKKSINLCFDGLRNVYFSECYAYLTSH